MKGFYVSASGAIQGHQAFLLSLFSHPSRGPAHNTSIDNSSHYAVSDPFNFNIATAIDPTYTRRTNDANTDRKMPVHQVTNSLPSEGWFLLFLIQIQVIFGLKG